MPMCTPNIKGNSLNHKSVSSTHLELLVSYAVQAFNHAVLADESMY